MLRIWGAIIIWSINYTLVTSSGHRSPKVLVYPDQGGLHKFVMGISVPVDVPKKFLSWGVNFQFQYQMPQNITEITQHFRPVKQGSSRGLPTRGDLYRVMEDHLNSQDMDMDGRACVLRTICEVSELPLQHNGLVGELIHAIFTPGYASIKGDDMEEDYATAESNGKLPYAGCRQKYTGCPIGHGLLDLIAYVHH